MSVDTLPYLKHYLPELVETLPLLKHYLPELLDRGLARRARAFGHVVALGSRVRGGRLAGWRNWVSTVTECG